MTSLNEDVEERNDGVPSGRSRDAADVLLEARGVTVRFGGVTALSGVSLVVPRRSIVGLVGPNGAGKSTLLGVMSGLAKHAEGSVFLRGEDVSRLSPEARVRKGVARTFQHPELFGDLSVRDHVVLALRARQSPSRVFSDILTFQGLRAPAPEEVDRCDEILGDLSLRGQATTRVSMLPLGLSRLVEVARALAIQPEVLLLDEPSSGLDRKETERLTEVLARLPDQRGLSILLVEHDVEMVLSLSQAVHVLDFGRTIAEGSPAEIRDSSLVQEAYLGRRQTDLRERPAAPVAGMGADGPFPEPLLEVEDLSVSYGTAIALDTVSLRVRPGAVVAVLGSNGAGKSTLGRALCGLLKSTSGRVKFNGVDITALAAHRIRRAGLAYLPEGRGVFPGLSVLDNMRMAVLGLPRGSRSDAISQALGYFPALSRRTRQIAGSLSGGEQQMLSLARVFAVTPRLIIADEMSLGLAPQIVDSVYAALETVCAGGVSVLLIEQFVDRALSWADYCYILRRGEVCWEGLPAAAGEDVLGMYLGADVGS